jgi:hypothetical protein
VLKKNLTTKWMRESPPVPSTGFRFQWARHYRHRFLRYIEPEIFAGSPTIARHFYGTPVESILPCDAAISRADVRHMSCSVAQARSFPQFHTRPAVLGAEHKLKVLMGFKHLRRIPMRKVLLTFAIVATIAIASSASAQTPYFQVYFDQAMQESSADCPAAPLGTVVDTLYVVAHNFNTWVTATDFMVDYGTHLSWLGEFAIGTTLKLGDSPTGVAITWQSRRNGWGPIPMLQVTVLWQCNDCNGISGTPGAEIVVLPNPGKIAPRVVETGTEQFIYGVGMTSLICALVPVEETTWGQIKSLYN